MAIRSAKFNPSKNDVSNGFYLSESIGRLILTVIPIEKAAGQECTETEPERGQRSAKIEKPINDKEKFPYIMMDFVL